MAMRAVSCTKSQFQKRVKENRFKVLSNKKPCYRISSLGFQLKIRACLPRLLSPLPSTPTPVPCADALFKHALCSRFAGTANCFKMNMNVSNMMGGFFDSKKVRNISEPQISDLLSAPSESAHSIPCHTPPRPSNHASM